MTMPQPAGGEWRKVTNPRYTPLNGEQLYYFYNTETKETTWETPRVYVREHLPPPPPPPRRYDLSNAGSTELESVPTRMRDKTAWEVIDEAMDRLSPAAKPAGYKPHRTVTDPKDLEEAEKLHKRLLYMNSAGVPQDYTRAAERPAWYPKSPVVDSRMYKHPDYKKPEPLLFMRPADSWNGSPVKYKRGM
eukprot:g4446.t1